MTCQREHDHEDKHTSNTSIEGCVSVFSRKLEEEDVGDGLLP